VDPVGHLAAIPPLGKVKTKCKVKAKECLHLRTPSEFNALIRIIVENRLPIFLAVDEIDHYIPPRGIDYYVHIWLQEGRNFEEGGLFTVRQVGLLNKELLSNAQKLVLFEIRNTNDIKYLQGMLDFDVKELINKLKRFEYAVIDMYDPRQIEFGHTQP